MTSKSLGIGLAGLGRHGMRYAQHLLAGDVPRARLVAVHRRDPETGRAWARLRDVTFHDSVAGLVADPAVDVLVAVLPPSLHPDAIAAAAAAKKPVLVEKPLATSPAAARHAIHSARSAGIRAMVAHTLRYNSVVRALWDMRQRVGEIQAISIDQRYEPAARAWLDDPAEGGPVLNVAAHGVDLLRFFSGAEVVEVRAFGRRIATRNVPDAFAAVLRLEPGDLLATLENTRAAGARTGRIEIVGSAGVLTADQMHGTLAEVHGRTRHTLPVDPPVPTVREVLRSFVDAMIEDKPTPIPLEDGLAAVEAAALIQSALGENA
ncbi:MAG: Gfo/Idh/MocA family oxidoreductase [Acidobacteria bacterium]|nr:Gfo/Idh/MocA family oxidoreductase [Acidobacteriota bacterium]